jgi:hypothetical protein
MSQGRKGPAAGQGLPRRHRRQNRALAAARRLVNKSSDRLHRASPLRARPYYFTLAVIWLLRRQPSALTSRSLQHLPPGCSSALLPSHLFGRPSRSSAGAAAPAPPSSFCSLAGRPSAPFSLRPASFSGHASWCLSAFPRRPLLLRRPGVPLCNFVFESPPLQTAGPVALVIRPVCSAPCSNRPPGRASTVDHQTDGAAPFKSAAAHQPARLRPHRPACLLSLPASRASWATALFTPAHDSDRGRPQGTVDLHDPSDHNPSDHNSESLSLFFRGPALIAVASSHSMLPQPLPSPAAGLVTSSRGYFVQSRFLPGYVRLRKTPSRHVMSVYNAS